MSETWCFAVDPLRADGRFGPTDCQTNRPSEGSYRGDAESDCTRAALRAVQGVEQMNEQAGFFKRIGKLFKGGNKATAELPDINAEERGDNGSAHTSTATASGHNSGAIFHSVDATR